MILEVNGHKLEVEVEFYMDEYEGTYFHVTKPDGSQAHLDWSGFGDRPTEGDFALWIELGYPDRHHPALDFEGRRVYSPINSQDLETIRNWKK